MLRLIPQHRLRQIELASSLADGLPFVEDEPDRSRGRCVPQTTTRAHRLNRHRFFETPNDSRRHADLFDFCEHPYPDPRGISETPGEAGIGQRQPRQGRTWAAEIQPRSTVDTNFLTLTRAEAHSPVNPAPNLVLGVQVLSQCRATLGRLPPAIVRLTQFTSRDLPARSV